MTFNYTDVIFPAVQGGQPVNLALNKPAWTSNNDTTYPSSLAVDGDPETMTRIKGLYRPFLAVDMVDTVMLEGMMLKLQYGECLV